MNDDQVLAQLRAWRAGHSALEIAQLLDDLVGLSQGALVMYFKRAFPEIPLRVLLDAGAWHRLSAGSMSDEEFDELLSPFLQVDE